MTSVGSAGGTGSSTGSSSTSSPPPAKKDPAPVAKKDPAPVAKKDPAPVAKKDPPPVAKKDTFERTTPARDKYQDALAQGPKVRGRYEVVSDTPAFGYRGLAFGNTRETAGTELNKIRGDVQKSVQRGADLEDQRAAIERRFDNFTGDHSGEMQGEYDDLRTKIEAEGKKGPISAERAREFQTSLDKLDGRNKTFTDNAKKTVEKELDDHVKDQLDHVKTRDALKEKTADAVLKDERDEAIEAAKKPKLRDPADGLRLFPGMKGLDGAEKGRLLPGLLRGGDGGPDMMRDLERIGELFGGGKGGTGKIPPGGELTPQKKFKLEGFDPPKFDDPDGLKTFDGLKPLDGVRPFDFKGLSTFKIPGENKVWDAQDALKSGFIANKDANVERDQRELAKDASTLLASHGPSADGLADWKKQQLAKLNIFDRTRAEGNRQISDLLKEAQTPLVRDRLALEERAAALNNDTGAYAKDRAAELDRRFAPIARDIDRETRGTVAPEKTDQLRTRLKSEAAQAINDTARLRYAEGGKEDPKLREKLDALGTERARINDERKKLGLGEYQSPNLDATLDRMRGLDKKVDDYDKDLTRKLLAKDDSLSRFENTLKASPDQKREYMSTLLGVDPKKLNYVEAHLAQKLLSDPEYQKKLTDYDRRTGLGPDADKLFHRDNSAFFDPTKYIPGKPAPNYSRMAFDLDPKARLFEPFNLRDNPRDTARGDNPRAGYADLFGSKATPAERLYGFSDRPRTEQEALVKEALGHKFFQDASREKYKVDDLAKIDPKELAADYRAWEAGGRAKKMGELKDADFQKYVEEARRADKILKDPSNLDLRLKKDPREFAGDDYRIYAQHREAQQLRKLDNGVGDRVRALDAEYKKHGWSPDSAWAGVSPHLFLQELNAKDPKTVSMHDARRALSALDGFRQENAKIFDHDPARLSGAGDKGNTLYKGLKEGAFKNPNDPFERLRKPIADLTPAERATVLMDHTRAGVTSLEQKMRAQSVQGLISEADRLDGTYQKALQERGFLGHTSDFLKNNIGVDDGWLIDSKLGSDALGKTVGGVYRSKNELEKLKNFQGTPAEFAREYENRRAGLEKAIRASEDHLKKYAKSQENWADGLSDVGSVLAAVGATALAPVTGGGSLVALGMGVAAGAGGKVLIKGTDALVGGRSYDSWGKDLLNGGFNGLGAGGGALARKQATEYMVKRAGFELTKESLAKMPLATKLAIAGAGSSLEGGIFGFTTGGGHSLVKGDPPDKALQNAMWSGAFGMVLNPLGEAAMKGLGAGFNAARGKELAGILDDAIPKPKKIGDNGHPPPSANASIDTIPELGLRDTIGRSGTATKTPAAGESHLAAIDRGMELMSRDVRSRLDDMLAGGEAGRHINTQLEELGAQLQKMAPEREALVKRTGNKGPELARFDERYNAIAARQTELNNQLAAAQARGMRLAEEEMSAFLKATRRDGGQARALAEKVPFDKEAVEKVAAHMKTTNYGNAGKLEGDALHQYAEKEMRDWMTHFFTYADPRIDPAKMRLFYEAPTAGKPRAFYEHGKGINVGDHFSKQTLFHEAAHPIEYGDAAVAAATKAWRDARVKRVDSTMKVEQLDTLVPNSGYKPHEKAYATHDFHTDYVGKVYGGADPATEVMTMFAQELVNPNKALNLYRRDPELFLLGLGLLRKP